MASSVGRSRSVAVGAWDYADGNRCTGSTLLGDQPIPSLDEIDADEEFTATAVTRSDFEKIWAHATQR
jgi:hypothetical protein